MASFCSDKLSSPRGASCPLCSSGSHFFLSAAYFALPLAALAGSSGLPVRFRMTFASPSTISSSTSSLRIAWVIAVDASVGFQEQLSIKELSIYALKWQTTSASFTENSQVGVGFLHFASLSCQDIPVTFPSCLYQGHALALLRGLLLP